MAKVTICSESGKVILETMPPVNAPKFAEASVYEGDATEENIEEAVACYLVEVEREKEELGNLSESLDDSNQE